MALRAIVVCWRQNVDNVAYDRGVQTVVEELTGEVTDDILIYESPHQYQGKELIFRQHWNGTSQKSLLHIFYPHEVVSILNK